MDELNVCHKYFISSIIQACSQKLQLDGSFVQSHGPFQQNSGLFNKFVVFSKKIVDLFDNFVAFSDKIVDLYGKIVDLLFERGFFHT